MFSLSVSVVRDWLSAPLYSSPHVRLSSSLPDLLSDLMISPGPSVVCLSALLISHGSSVCLSARLFSWSPLFRLSASLLVCHSDLPWSVCLPVCLSALLILPVCLSAILLVCFLISTCPSVWLTCPFVYSSELTCFVCLPVCLSAHGTVRLFSSVVDSYGYNRLIMEANKICRSAHYPVKLDSPWGVDQGGGERSGSSATGFCAVRYLQTCSGTPC